MGGTAAYAGGGAMMDEPLQVNVGDWVRFYKGGLFTIAEVRYMKRLVTSRTVYCTDQGEVWADQIMEVRKP